MMSNTNKATLRLVILTGLLVLFGSLLGGTGGMLIAFTFAVLLNAGLWWFSGTLALYLSGAYEISAMHARDLHHIVHILALDADIPKPRVYVIDTLTPRAFAAGRNPENSAIVVRTGLIHGSTRDQLTGVIAGELAHIKRRNPLISSLVGAMSGAITMVAELGF